MKASGRSPAAFIGSLAGTGNIALENAQLAGLNPRVFDAVIRAVDLGIPTDANRIRDFVMTALENGTLPVARAEAAITIAAGQARLSNVGHPHQRRRSLGQRERRSCRRDARCAC